MTPGQQVLAAMIAAGGAVIVALISFFGGRGSVSAQLQGQLNQSFKELTDQLQEERDLEKVARAAEVKRAMACEARIAGLEQHIYSLENLLRRQGIEVPPRKEVAPIFILDSSVEEHANG